ncbi:MAG TPA: hypothetical protein VGH56_07605, partial [Solirubrobacteraceae bacterium]
RSEGAGPWKIAHAALGSHGNTVIRPWLLTHLAAKLVVAGTRHGIQHRIAQPVLVHTRRAQHR